MVVEDDLHIDMARSTEAIIYFMMQRKTTITFIPMCYFVSVMRNTFMPIIGYMKTIVYVVGCQSI